MTCETFQIKELEVGKHQEMTTEAYVQSVKRNGGGKRKQRGSRGLMSEGFVDSDKDLVLFCIRRGMI